MNVYKLQADLTWSVSSCAAEIGTIPPVEL